MTAPAATPSSPEYADLCGFLPFKETLITRIETNGTDVIIAGRRNGGIAIEQGTSHILLTPSEAAELARALTDVLQPRIASPAKARILQYPMNH